jgi:hypothetical protein
MLLVELAQAPTRTREAEARLAKLHKDTSRHNRAVGNSAVDAETPEDAALRDWNSAALLLEEDEWAQEMRDESESES